MTPDRDNVTDLGDALRDEVDKLDDPELRRRLAALIAAIFADDDETELTETCGEW